MLHRLLDPNATNKLTPRKNERYSMSVPAQVSQGHHVMPCKVKDVSSAGAMVEFQGDPCPFQEHQIVRFTVPGQGTCEANLRWIEPFKAGLEFRISEAEKQILASYLETRLADQF